eukprot:TRINITY_DN16519_c0_g1_i3.p1 TRINITY_DN16519_c0_g1~~TRINITY_DN16519_c0_g1_i3.p1  ORF type:complete len:1163 (+),score=177.37 TRINITY_DN16519_c0_g1_i3:66-3554(+)
MGAGSSTKKANDQKYSKSNTNNGKQKTRKPEQEPRKKVSKDSERVEQKPVESVKPKEDNPKEPAGELKQVDNVEPVSNSDPGDRNVDTTQVEEISSEATSSPQPKPAGTSPRRGPRRIPAKQSPRTSGKQFAGSNSARSVFSKSPIEKRDRVIASLKEILAFVKSEPVLTTDTEIETICKEIQNATPDHASQHSTEDRKLSAYSSNYARGSLFALAEDSNSAPLLCDTAAWDANLDHDDPLESSMESRGSCFSQLLSELAGGNNRTTKKDDGEPQMPEFDLLTSAAEVVAYATGDRKQLSRYICKEVNWLLRCGACTIWWYDKDTGQLAADISSLGCTADAATDTERLGESSSIRASDGVMNEMVCPLLPNSPEGIVIESNGPKSLGTLGSSKYKHHEKVPITEVLYAPVRMNGEVIGICKCCNKLRSHGTEFSDDDINLLSAFLIFASACIKNCFLYRDLTVSHDNTKRLLDMTQDMGAHTLNSTKLCESIMRTANHLLKSESSNLYLVSADNKRLQTIINGATFTFDIDNGIEGYVARTGEVVRTNEAGSHPSFSNSLDEITDTKTTSILCAPIFQHGRVIAVSQLINKNDVQGFTSEDEKTFVGLNTFCGAHLANAFEHNKVVEERQINLRLLETAESLQRVDILDSTAVQMKVRENAQTFMPCDSSELWMVEKERNWLVNIAQPLQTIQLEDTILQEVVSSGNRVIFSGSDERLDGEAAFIGYKDIRQLLCIPIKSLENDVLFVSVLCNRDSEFGHFSEADLAVMDIFISFASMCLRTSSLVQFMKRADDAHSRLMRQMGQPQRRGGLGISVHKSGTLQKLKGLVDSSKTALALEPITEDESSVLITAGFPIHNYNISNPAAHGRLPRLAVEFFRRFKIPEEFSVNELQILQFIRVVQRKYRNVPYHNFTHAFDVTQAICVYLSMMPDGKYITNLERFALIVTALCHDIDHMGLNNSFQLKAETPLGVLSSTSGNTSVLEVHHCNLTIDILSDPATNVFSGLDQQQAKDAWKTIIECILGTDMARHEEICSDFESVCLDYDVSDIAHRRSMLLMLLKAADISNITRPFQISKMWAQYVTTEFHWQGDTEKAVGLDVTPMFNRQNGIELAQGQIGFMENVGIPMYDILTKGIPELQEVADQLKCNRDTWKTLLQEKSPS